MEVDGGRLVRWLQELIRIPSVTRDEAAAARYVEEELRALGYRPNVESHNVWFETGEGPTSLLLNSHLDTVELGKGWTRDPFGGVLEGDRVYGRGASDDKGNIAAMLEIARLAKGRKLGKRLLFTFTTGEEFGTTLEEKGSFLLAQHLRADKALVLEPQFDVKERRLNIIHGCRGIENIKVEVKGKGAHTGYPERGINAVSRAARILSEIEKLTFHSVEVPGQTVTTICMPIKIEGGAGIFLVPDRCEILVHARTAPEDDRLVKDVERICREVCGADFTMTTPYSAPGYVDTHEDPLIDLIRKEASACGWGTETRFAGGRIDASIFKNVAGIPSFCTGVGDRDQMHLIDEFLTVSDFVTGSELLKNVVFSGAS
jgi:acetylornithine deacetylase/succinyl-diaminopimelate desuccinylase-like protein